MSLATKLNTADTLPKLLKYNYEQYGDSKVAMRVKQFGVWQEYTWKDYFENVKYLSLGLISLGLEKGVNCLSLLIAANKYYGLLPINGRIKQSV